MGMEPNHRAISLRNVIVRAMLFGVFILLLRFVYVVTIQDVSETFNLIGIEPALKRSFRSSLDQYFQFPVGETVDESQKRLWTSKNWRKTVDFYSLSFQDLLKQSLISSQSKALCVGTKDGQDVLALKELGVSDSIGISLNPSPPLVIYGDLFQQPFPEDTFDFEFSGNLDSTHLPENLASEMVRTLKPGGVLVLQTSHAKDMYSFNSFIDLFKYCRVLQSRERNTTSLGVLREIVLIKDENPYMDVVSESVNQCSVPEHKRKIARMAEPLIMEEPLKPWLTLKRNIKNIKYLSSMVDISFKRKYVYIDVGSRSYGSSIGSWFKKQYPKQNKTFEVFAIEADKTFHEEYSKKKGVKLVPKAAWVRDEMLRFEINGEDSGNGRGMGRIQMDGSNVQGRREVVEIEGFDFAKWVKSNVDKRDYVVMKMDVEGTEFDLLPNLFETGAICLIDEIFLECHYNRWQKCCPERSKKYKKTYGDCMNLFTSLRESGVLVHQWW
ncbi:hypothetical protein AMTRI_Chr08g207680 [Amborella trichopoda]